MDSLLQLEKNDDSLNSLLLHETDNKQVIATDEYVQLQSDDEKELSKSSIDPWSKSYIGIQVNYFCSGIFLGGTLSILYPFLIVEEGVTSSEYNASKSLIDIPWSYKILFGALCECFPLFGLKIKPYIILGWILSSSTFIFTALLGNGIRWETFVLLLTLSNTFCVLADVAADGFMVRASHRESDSKKGKFQTLIYTSRYVGQLFISLVILFFFSGPQLNCPGYVENSSKNCTDDEEIASRNDMYEDYPEDWCHKQCDDATFKFGLDISGYSWICGLIFILSLPFYLILREEETPTEKFYNFMLLFWQQIKKHEVWQCLLYAMISNLTFGVYNAAKDSANFVWLDLTTTQNQIMLVLENLVFIVGLMLIKKYALTMSWRKLVWIGTIFVTFWNVLYFLIIFDIYRNVWFYIFTDVSKNFIYTLNYMAASYCIVAISETGFEIIIYALYTSATNVVVPLATVVSNQLMSFFPDLDKQEQLETDTDSIRRDMAYLHLIVIIINLSSLLSLPILQPQRREARELMARGETSFYWGLFTMISGFVFIIYSTVATFLKVAKAETYGCYKILGGEGCSDGESSVPTYLLVFSALFYCYSVNFYLTFWPIIIGQKSWSFSIFF